MHLHQSVVNKMLYWCTNYGGHANETKLVDMLGSLRISPYVRTEATSTDSIVLVDTEDMLKECVARKLPTNTVAAMKFHGTVLTKVMELYKSLSGHTNESKLRNAFSNLDLTPYDAKTTGESYVVLTEDFMKAIRGTKN